jgi:hypothetical protein
VTLELERLRLLQLIKMEVAAYVGLPEKWKIASAAVDLSC